MKAFFKSLQTEINSPAAQLVGKFSSISLICFYIYYGLFYLFQEPIHNFYPVVNPENIIYYHRLALARDGLESKVMLVGSLVFLGSCFWLSKQKALLKLFNHKLSHLVVTMPLFYLIIQTRSEIFKLAPWRPLLLLIFGLVALLWLIGKDKLISGKWKRLIGLFGFLLFGLVVVLSLDQASIYDWNYFLAPARKMIQKETIGSYYMQYNLIGTFLVKIFMDLSLKVTQMQLLAALSLVFWYGLYYLLARKVISHPVIRTLFMICLVVLRFLAINHDPSAVFQVTPIRMDLWVLGLLGIAYFGLKSWWTAIIFGGMYLADNLFGFLYGSLYGLAILTLEFYNLRKGRLDLGDWFKKTVRVLTLCLPLIVAAVFNLYFFRALYSPSASLHLQLQIDFLPIDYRSPFWLLLASLPICLYLILKESEYKLRTAKLLALAILLVQLIYFYGRSHDHNLLNISGLIVLVWFIALDCLSKSLKNISLLIASALILTSLALFSGHIMVKLSRMVDHIQSGKLFPKSFIEDYVDKNPDLLDGLDKSKLVMISPYFDGYFNYRYGLIEQGYFAPFLRNEYVDQTIDFLTKQIDKGQKPVFTVWDPQMFLVLEQFNSSKTMQERGQEFVVIRHPKDVVEVGLVNISRTIKEIDQTKKYRWGQVSFNYPQSWFLERENDLFKVEDPDKVLKVTISAPRNLNNQAVDSYLSSQPGLGELLNQGLAKIPNFDSSFVRIWRVDHLQLMQFFLFSGQKVVEIRVTPSTSGLMRGFDQIVASLNF